MKRIFFLVITIICVFNIFICAQEINNPVDGKSFEVRLEKSNYLQGEPIFARFNCVLSSNEPSPNFISDSSIKISFNGNIKEYLGLSPIIGSGRGKVFPPDDKKIILLPYSEENRISRVDEFFPIPGDYQIQFYIYGLSSNIINIKIEEPTGINKEAFDFLKSNGVNGSFNLWTPKIKDSISLLEQFVANYGGSVYAESAIHRLAVDYLNVGELDKAQREFEKIKNNKHEIFAKSAKTNLSTIKNRKEYIQKMNQPNRP